MITKKVTVIAEIGVNHNGSLELAKRLIVEAKNSGADIAKFQYFNPATLASPSSPLAEYQRKGLVGSAAGEQLSMLQRLQLSLSDFGVIRDVCVENQIEFGLSFFDHEDIEPVSAALGLRRIKIPSGEINNEAHVKAAASLGVPVIISTGMATIREIENAMAWVTSTGLSREQVTLLQCTSAYPTPPNEMNVRVIATLRDQFGVEAGLSDHSNGLSAGCLSVAFGATVVEKHLTLDRGLEGPDHQASLDPDGFRLYCELIRRAEKELGSPTKAPSLAELGNREIVRRSPHARKQISLGEKFGPENILLLRPEAGISADQISLLFGKMAGREYRPGEVILPEELNN